MLVSLLLRELLIPKYGVNVYIITTLSVKCLSLSLSLPYSVKNTNTLLHSIGRVVWNINGFLMLVTTIKRTHSTVAWSQWLHTDKVLCVVILFLLHFQLDSIVWNVSFTPLTQLYALTLLYTIGSCVWNIKAMLMLILTLVLWRQGYG